MIFLLFGWGYTTKKILDETKIKVCEGCNKDYLYLTKITKWFTIFFIPIIPYESEHYFLCPNCERGFEIDEDEVDSIIKKIEKLNKKDGRK